MKLNDYHEKRNKRLLKEVSERKPVSHDVFDAQFDRKSPETQKQIRAIFTISGSYNTCMYCECDQAEGSIRMIENGIESKSADVCRSCRDEFKVAAHPDGRGGIMNFEFDFEILSMQDLVLAIRSGSCRPYTKTLNRST